LISSRQQAFVEHRIEVTANGPWRHTQAFSKHCSSGWANINQAAHNAFSA
jgi:ribosomal protein L35